MHDIEPHYNWRHLYIADEDERSPFFGRIYSEFEFTHAIYNYLIHPQWDEFGSATLYLKILYVNYDEAYAVIEMIGEWNDLLYNDIMFLKRNVIESLIEQGIVKFILILENVLNFHASDDSYYQEWFEEAEDGWIAAINLRKHVREEFSRCNLDYYIALGGPFDIIDWRRYSPQWLFGKISELMRKRLGE